MRPRHKSVETRYMEERSSLFSSLKNMDRRNFLKVSTAALGAVLAKGILPPHSFFPVQVSRAEASTGKVEAFRFAYISDSTKRISTIGLHAPSCGPWTT
jgi:hypothetical protein